MRILARAFVAHDVDVYQPLDTSVMALKLGVCVCAMSVKISYASQCIPKFQPFPFNTMDI